MLLLTSIVVVGATPLMLPNFVASIAGKDSWLSVIIASIVGLPIIWVYTYLVSLYPGKTIVEITQLLLGKWFGGVLALNFVFITLIGATSVIWYMGDFFTTVYMTGSSNYMITILFIAVLALALLYGVEVIARARELTFIFIFPLFIMVLLFILPEIKFSNLLPVMESGVFPVINGIFPLINNAISPVLSLLMIFTANITDIKEGKKSIFKGYLLGMFELFSGMTICILVIGDKLTANLRYPLFTVTKEINIGMIFSRIEALIVIIWLVISFFTALISFYAGTVGLSQVLKLKDYKKIVLPLSLIVTVYSGFIYKNSTFQLTFDKTVRTQATIIFGIIIPVVLLIISLVRKRKTKKYIKA